METKIDEEISKIFHWLKSGQQNQSWPCLLWFFTHFKNPSWVLNPKKQRQLQKMTSVQSSVINKLQKVFQKILSQSTSYFLADCRWLSLNTSPPTCQENKPAKLHMLDLTKDEVCLQSKQTNKQTNKTKQKNQHKNRGSVTGSSWQNVLWWWSCFLIYSLYPWISNYRLLIEHDFRQDPAGYWGRITGGCWFNDHPYQSFQC